MRTPPAIVAQAAATSAALMPGRFFLGVGTGENLNEHITADRWPSHEERLEMLEEAIDVIRRLWRGDLVTHRGRWFTVDRARIYTLPDEPPPIAVAASGPRAAELAGSVGDALVSTAPDEELVEAFERAGGEGKPKYGQLTVCYAESEDEAVETAHTWWPNAALTGMVTQELALPSYFEQAAETVTADEVTEVIVCGPDADRHRKGVAEFAEAGFDHVYVHQVGPDQEGFLRFYERELIRAPAQV
jgi:G6PDH family F420-dependent oxidoreductase